jgi:NAD+ kinase
MKTHRVILFVNNKNKNARNLASVITSELKTRNIDADFFSVSDEPFSAANAAYDIAISLGGDGTVLSAARAVSHMGIPVFPVNLGTFGFIAGISPSDWLETFERWLGDKALFSRRLMLEVTVTREGREIARGCCLNDAVISAAGAVKMIKLKLSCSENNSKDFMKLGLYHSDGIIVSTPTGSTAYSAAAAGPIVDPELEALIINPICPFTLTHRPMVLPAGETVAAEVDKSQKNGVQLTLDGQITEKLKSGDRVYFKKAPYSCSLIASGRRGFYQALRTKLSWAGEGVSLLTDDSRHP